MSEKVIVSSPTKRTMAGPDGMTEFTVSYAKRGGSGSIKVTLDLDDDRDTMRALYDEALYDELVRVGIPDPVVIREDEIFGAVVRETREVRIEPRVEQRVIERAVVRTEPASRWQLVAAGMIGGALGVAARFAWVVLILEQL